MTSYYCPRCGWRLDADPEIVFALACGLCETPLAPLATDCPTMRALGQNPFFLARDKLTPLPKDGHWKTDAPRQ